MEGHEKDAAKLNGRFYQAIKQDGWSNFTCAVLQTYSTIEEASEGEKYWIKQLKTMDPEFGYNTLEGGLSPKFIQEYKIRNGLMEPPAEVPKQENLPPRLKIKEYKQLNAQSYVRYRKKKGMCIIRTTTPDVCKKCGDTIGKGIYVLWKRGAGIIHTYHCTKPKS